LRDFYLPKAKAANLDIFLGGHSHLYQHGSKEGVHYFIIGGGGGDLETDRVENYGLYYKTILQFHSVIIEMKRCELVLNVYSVGGDEMDEVRFTSKTCKQ